MRDVLLVEPTLFRGVVVVLGRPFYVKGVKSRGGKANHSLLSAGECGDRKGNELRVSNFVKYRILGHLDGYGTHRRE